MRPKLRQWVACLLGLALGLLAFGDRLATAGDRITYEEILRHLEVGSPSDDIANLVREADEVAVTSEQLPALVRAGATPALIQAIEQRLSQGSVFSLDTVYRLIEEGRPHAEIVDRILAEGARFDLTARDRQALIRKNASADVIRALEGKYEYPGFSTYTAEHRLFSVQLPRDWQAGAWYASEGYVAVLSPERGVQKRDDFTVGFQVQTGMLWEGSDYARLPLESVRARDQEGFFRRNKELEPTALEGDGSRPQAFRVAGHRASIEKFQLKMKGVPCLEWLIVVGAEDVLFTLECIAPLERFAELEQVFLRMLRTFRAFPDRVQLVRREEALDSAAAVTRYRDAVVQVRAEFEDGAVSSGSGFFVRSDGYVLTNHHVICSREDHSRCDSMQASQLPRRVTLLWDKAVGPRRPGEARRQVPATILDTVSAPPLVDLALLRVPRAAEPYRTIPLSPVGRTRRTGLVRSGDPIVALGFPLPSQITPDEVMATTGTVARLVTEETPLQKGARVDRLEYLYMTAQIQPGNSGGPCISLRTNGVIGLNTTAAVRQGQQLGYFGVCPIDEALNAFPQVKFYPFGRDLPPEGHVELGTMLVDAENTRAARTELVAALQQVDRMAPADAANLYYQVGRCFDQMKNRTSAEKAFRDCLQNDPDHEGALASLAYLQPWNQVDLAIPFVERLVRSHPENYWSYYHRAEFRRRAKQYEQAQEDITQALDMGGHNEPAVYRLRGKAFLDADECGPGVAAYQRALALDPGDYEAKLGIAECAVRSKNVAGALVEYARITEAHPEEPLVQETYGRILLQQEGRRSDGLDHLVTAVVLLLDRDRAPSPELLSDAADASLAEGRADAAVILARQLHRLWPAWRGSANELLGRRWLQEHPSVARAHLLTARGQGINSSVSASGLPARLLSLKDLNALIARRYEPALLVDVLAQASLGFDFDFDPRYMDKQQLGLFQEAGWGPMDVLAVNARFRVDQMTGSAELAAQVRADLAEQQVTSASNAPWGEVTFANQGSVALTEFQIEYRYLAKDGSVLWETTSSLQNRMPPLLPGEVRRFPFVWHTYEILRRKGAGPEVLSSMEFKIVSARNAHYIRKIAMQGVFSDDHSVYRLEFRNDSLFHLRNVWIRVDYVDSAGDPILGQSGRFRGQPIHKVLPVPVKDFVLKPGEAATVSIPGLDDAEALRALDFPTRGVSGASVRVRVVEAVPYEP